MCDLCLLCCFIFSFLFSYFPLRYKLIVEPTPTLKAGFCGPGRDCVPSLPTDEKAEKSEKAVNGEDKGDSGVETQNSEGNADEECDPLGPNCYYDKSKSFFDNISCDDTRSFQKPPCLPSPEPLL